MNIAEKIQAAIIELHMAFQEGEFMYLTKADLADLISHCEVISSQKAGTIISYLGMSVIEASGDISYIKCQPKIVEIDNWHKETKPRMLDIETLEYL